MTTVIVPLDGSHFAESALPTASWLARKLRADLRLVTTTFVADADGMERYLAEKAAASGIEGAQGEIVRPHFPGSGISEYAAGHQDAVLCMTTHGHSGVADILLGGVADEVVRSAAGPVVLVGPHAAKGEPVGQRIIACVDGSAPSQAILPTVSTWADHLLLPIDLVTVAEHDGSAWDQAAAHAELTALAAGLRADGRSVNVTVIPADEGKVADRLLAHAERYSGALIAIATHGRGGLLSNALGSVVTHVVRHSTRPVLVCRPAGTET